ncbi:hypothetical protein GA0115251_106455 [Streptomyces sp. TverLS-915]|nr:hypothetical protein GA0115251_106455 [Streptomyces sp. TverLS-915]
MWAASPSRTRLSWCQLRVVRVRKGRRVGGGVRGVLAEERGAVEESREEPFEGAELDVLLGGVETEAAPSGGGALDDAGAALGPVPVGVAPDPAVRGVDEREAEAREDLGGADPDVDVAALGEARAEVVRVVAAQGAADAVRGDEEVGGGGCGGVDRAAVADVDAEVAGARGEEGEEAVAADAVALVAVVLGDLLADAGAAVLPGERGGVEGVGAGLVVGAEPVEEFFPVGHAPAVGGAGGVAFVHGDLVRGVLEFHQDREVQPAGAASGTDDLHVRSRSVASVASLGRR